MEENFLTELTGGLALLTLALAILTIVIYVLLVRRQENEKCPKCGTLTPIKRRTCQKCGESTMRAATPAPRLGLLLLILLLAAVALVFSLMSALPSKEPPSLNKLVVSAAAFLVMILVIFISFWGTGWIKRTKQAGILLEKSFFGGFCGNCGAEMLGGMSACPQCNQAVILDPPNWVIKPVAGGEPSTPPDVKIICYKCKAENPAEAQTCQKCGRDLLSFKPIWLRVTYFLVSLLICAGLAWLAYNLYSNPKNEEFANLFGIGAISLAITSVITPFYGLNLALGQGSYADLLAERADRHKTPYPWQALIDTSHALELAPANKQPSLLTKRMKLYGTLGLTENATRDELAITYAKENNPQGGVGLYLGSNLIGSTDPSGSFEKGWLSGVAKQARKDRLMMYKQGRVIAMGYCPHCQQVVDLDDDLRCFQAAETGVKRHFGKPKYVQFTVPSDHQAGLAAVRVVMENAGKKRTSRALGCLVIFIAVVLLGYLIQFLSK